MFCFVCENQSHQISVTNYIYSSVLSFSNSQLYCLNIPLVYAASTKRWLKVYPEIEGILHTRMINNKFEMEFKEKSIQTKIL